MTLPTLPTLAYVRAEILQRCAINTGGNRGARAIPMVDSAIRQAIRQLEIECPWTRLQVTRQITLLADTTVYDFPDDMDAGNIGYIGVHNIDSNKVATLRPDPDHRIRNGLVNTIDSAPRIYWFEGSVINILPEPDVTVWDYLVLDGYLNATIPTNDTEQLGFDGEAVIQLAEELVRPRLGLDVPPALMTARQVYMSHLRARQGDGEGTMPGGHTSEKVRPEGPNRYYGRYEWDTNWNPSGDWGP
jgi:hypothetical protein